MRLRGLTVCGEWEFYFVSGGWEWRWPGSYSDAKHQKSPIPGIIWPRVRILYQLVPSRGSCTLASLSMRILFRSESNNTSNE